MDSNATRRTKSQPARTSFWWLFILLAVVILATAAVVFYYERGAKLAELRATERQQVQIAVELMRQRLIDVSATVRWLARLPALQRLASGESHYGPQVEQAFVALLEEVDQVDQARYLDEAGNEVVRVNLRDGHIEVVAKSQLQNKAHRYYFKGGVAQRPGVVYASRFDLNVERGEIEQPYKPVIRLSSRVADVNGRAQGLLLINFLGESLRDKILRLLSDSLGETMLLNQDGYWLMAPDPDEEWGFMFNRPPGFVRDYPQAWQQVQAEHGQFLTPDGLYTFATLDPSTIFGTQLQEEGAIGKWKLISRVPPASLQAVTMPLALRVALVASVALLLALLFSIWFTRLGSERRRLRKDNVVYLQRAKEKEGILDLFIQHTPAAVAMFDTEMRYIAVSRRWYQEYGLQEDLAGRSHFDVFPRLDDRWREILRRCLEGEVLSSDDDSFTCADGSTRWLRWEIRPWYTAAGDVGGVIMLTENISARKQAEQIREGFIAKVSHELRTPITAVDGSLKLLLGGVGGMLSDRAHTLIETAHRNSVRLLVLVNDLLDLQKIKLGELDLNFSEVRITRVADDVAASCQPLAAQKAVEIRVEHGCDNPLLVTDGARVHQVLTNFVSNAIRHTPAGRSVTIRTRCEPDRVECAVIDEGTGVPEHFMNRIFEDFEQAETGDTRTPGGSGLGLSIARALIRRLGGEIGFENLQRGGARFFFVLPRCGTVSDAGDHTATGD